MRRLIVAIALVLARPALAQMTMVGSDNGPAAMLWNTAEVPWASTSLWNKKIPNTATYTPVSWPAPAGQYFISWGPGQADIPVYIATSADPVLTVTVVSSWGWPANPSLHVPAAAQPGGGTDANCIIVDGQVAYNFWQFVHSGSTASASAWAQSNIFSGTGFGTAGAIGACTSGPCGAGISANGASQYGMLVLAQANTGSITHALSLFVENDMLNGTVVSPAISTDGSTGGAPLSESNLLAIPSGTAMPGGLSPLGQKVFTALQVYGGYITERGGTGNGFRGMTQEYNSSLRSSLNTDLATIFPMLEIVH